jgi:hypothetical protein
MKTILTGALAALALAGALSATALPAAAEDHHGGRGGWGGEQRGWRGGRGGGWGGDHREWRGGGWGGGGWGGGGWDDDWGGASAALLGLGVGAAIADAPYGYPPAYYGPSCRIEPRWNPSWGGYQQVRVCY